MKPFILKEALAGKAVMLRSGEKAYVRHHETELDADEHRKLVGYTSIGIMLTWREDGRFVGRPLEPGRDIIGMYPETKTINGFEVPAPETQAPEEGTTYYFPILHTVDLYSTGKWNRDEAWHKRYLWRGLVFLNKEGAVANAEAMLGINPNTKDNVVSYTDPNSEVF